jgi:hypothetical protein
MAVEWVADTIWAVVAADMKWEAAAEDIAMRWEVVEISVEVKEI